jgi:serine/threonine protein kinase
MTLLPDFSGYGYHVESELGSNRAGGRVTYLALAAETQQQVVLKQFQFAKSSSAWSGYDTHSREIDVLRGLNHPGIPRYLDSFQTQDGFCMVQEYKNARSLGVTRSFSPDDVRHIAVSALQILVYLQNRIPPVIHRDVKPENILVDEQLNVYLVDFGFARVGDGEVGVSSVVKGTLGFMPPEQLFNRRLTEASDLYGLGVTLICLLTRTRSDEIGKLVDISYRVSFKHLVPRLSIHWLNWLEKMVEPKLNDRFANAAEALASLPTSPIRLPEARFSQSSLTFSAKQLGEKITQIITISNSVPETHLEGTWEVAPHASDPPHTPHTHAWISVQPAKFTSDQVDCQITIDTARLMANKLYNRTLLLHTNASANTYSLSIQVKTAPIPVRTRSLPYGLLSLLFLCSGVAAWAIALSIVVVGAIINAPLTIGFGATVGAAIGFQIVAWMLATAGASTGAITSVIAGVVLGGLALVSTLLVEAALTGVAVISGVGVGLVGSILAGAGLGSTAEHLLTSGLSRRLAVGVSLITAVAGFCLGLCFAPGVFKPLVISIALGTGLVGAGMAAYVPLHRAKLIADYRQAEQYSIKP